MRTKLRAPVGLSVLFGAIAWIAYSLAETAMMFLLDLPFRPASDPTVTAWSLQWAGFSSLLYLATGLAISVATGLFLAWLGMFYDWQSELGATRVPYGLATLGMVLAVAAQGIYRTPLNTAPGIVLALMGAAFTVAIILALLRGAEDSTLTVVANPWVAAFCLPAAPWLVGHVLQLGALAVIVELLAIVLIAAVLVRLTRITRSGSPALQWARPLVAMVLIAVTWGMMFWASNRTYWHPSEWPAAKSLSPSSIVLIVLDTVRAESMSLYGYEQDTTPNLRELARYSTVYTRATAPSNWTLPSHASMFTGLYPRRHGAHDAARLPVLGDPLDESFTAVAELLQQKGYWTMAAVANAAVVSPENGMAQGFQNYQGRVNLDYYSYLLMGSVRAITERLPYSALTLRGPRAAEMNRISYDLMDQAKQRDAGLFLFINYLDAHEPYVPPAPYDTMFAGKDPSFGRHDYVQLTRQFAGGQETMPDATAAAMLSQYDGAIRYIDEQIGLLVDHLKQNGQFEDSLFIVTSDHGEAFGDHGLIGHSCSLFEDQIGVPLLIKYPGQKAGSTVGANASLVDIMPTILDVAGMTIPPALDGISLRQSESAARQSVIAEGYPMWMWRGPKKAIQRALRQNDLKLLVSQTGETALYDVAANPAEDENVRDARPAESQQMREALQSWLEAVPAFKGKFQELDSKSLERLRGLGYIQ